MIDALPTEIGTETDGGPDARRQVARTCIVTRRSHPRGEGLIRFVVSPGGEVTPDLKARLPGRGAWVGASRDTLAQAIKRKAFARAFKREVTVAPDLLNLVDRLVEERAIAALALANKAGIVVTGFAKVEAAISANRVALLLHASEAGADGRRKLAAAWKRRYGVDPCEGTILSPFASAQMDLALGRENVVHAALLAGPASEGFRASCAALETYRGELTTPPASRRPGEQPAMTNFDLDSRRKAEDRTE